MNIQRQLFRPPDLLLDPAGDVLRWLRAQEPVEAVGALRNSLVSMAHNSRSWHGLAILPVMVCLVCFVVAQMVVMSSLAALALLGFAVTTRREKVTLQQRRAWLCQQLILQLEQGGRQIPLGDWISSVAALGSDRRHGYETLAHRLGTATTEELRQLNPEQRGWLRTRLKDEWPGEELQVALLLALGTAGDIFTKPYARRLVTNPNESETVREAAEECLRSLEN